MTLKQLNTIRANRQRLAESYRSLIATRNTIIDSFDKEYLRHVKLNSKKEDPRRALLQSLSKSRNMKKIQKEFLENKLRIKENQSEAKAMKKTFQEAKSLYEENLVQKRKTQSAWTF
jgi:hypothetical protein